MDEWATPSLILAPVSPKKDPKTQPKTEERKPLEKQYEIPEKEKVQEQSGEKFDSDSKQRVTPKNLHSFKIVKFALFVQLCEHSKVGNNNFGEIKINNKEQIQVDAYMLLHICFCNDQF